MVLSIFAEKKLHEIMKILGRGGVVPGVPPRSAGENRTERGARVSLPWIRHYMPESHFMRLNMINSELANGDKSAMTF